PTTVCNRTVYHADGTPADAKSPAKPGEAVTVHLYGLGKTIPAAATGATSPSNTGLTDLLDHPRVQAALLKDFGNALSSTPRSFRSQDPGAIMADNVAGSLLPGQIGVYQLSISIPQSASPSLACGGEIHTNTVLIVSTSQGSESTAFCIKPD